MMFLSSIKKIMNLFIFLQRKRIKDKTMRQECHQHETLIHFSKTT